MNVCRDVCRPSCAPLGAVPKALIRKDIGEWAGRLCSGLQIRSPALKSNDFTVADPTDKPRTKHESVPLHFLRAGDL